MMYSKEVMIMEHSRSERRPLLVAQFIRQDRISSQLQSEPDKSGNYKGLSKDSPRGQRTVPGPGNKVRPGPVIARSPDGSGRRGNLRGCHIPTESDSQRRKTGKKGSLE